MFKCTQPYLQIRRFELYSKEMSYVWIVDYLEIELQNSKSKTILIQFYLRKGGS